MSYIIFILSFLLGATGITSGIIIAYIFSKLGRTTESFLSGCTAGIMLSVVYISILPEAFKSGGLLISLLGIILGVMFVVLVEIAINRLLSFKKKHNNYIRMGIAFAIGLAIHNFPEGIAIGTLGTVSLSKSIQFAIIIALHNIPEGIMIGIPLKKAKIRFKVLLSIGIIIGLVIGIGAYIGYIAGSISDIYLTISFSFAAGVMLYITCEELQIKEGQNINIYAILLGILIGIAICK